MPKGDRRGSLRISLSSVKQCYSLCNNEINNSQGGNMLPALAKAGGSRR